MDAKTGVQFSDCQYTFVVEDYGHNMELPVYYNQEQPGVKYYYSPLSVYNLGVVNHAHENPNSEVKEHMYVHVYHKEWGRREQTMKMLRRLNLLHEDSAGRRFSWQ